MKKWFLIVSSIVLVLVLGTGMITLHGHGQRSYNACFRLGQNDVIDGNYRDALNYFQGAQKVNPESSKDRDALDQTQSYVSGSHYFARRKLGIAAREYQRSIKIGAITALNRRSMVDYKKVNQIQSWTRHFTGWYDQALILNHRQDFKSSARRLDRILNRPSVNLKYFKRFKNRVIKLKKTDEHDRRSNQVTSNVRANYRDTDSFKLKAPKVIEGHPSKVTITKARREIRRAGVNVKEMSDRDVANLIRQADRYHANVYRYAKDNY